MKVDIKVDGNNHAITTHIDGYTDLALVSGYEETSQNVRLKLLIEKRQAPLEPVEAISWVDMIHNKALWPVLGQKIRTLVLSVEGVASVDLTDGYFDNRKINLGGICYTHECGEKVELSA